MKRKTCDRTLERLWDVIQDRKKKPQKGSYTRKLLKNRRLLLRKIREESAEVVKSRRKYGKDSLTWETADLIYHLLVLLAAKNVEFEDVLKELEGRMPKAKKEKLRLFPDRPDRRRFLFQTLWTSGPCDTSGISL